MYFYLEAVSEIADGLLCDVPLHDVWTISLTGGGPNRTMRDVEAISPSAHHLPRPPLSGYIVIT